MEARQGSILAEDTTNLEPSKVDDQDTRRLLRRKDQKAKKNVIQERTTSTNRNAKASSVVRPKSSSDESNTLEDLDYNPTSFKLVSVSGIDKPTNTWRQADSKKRNIDNSFTN